MPATKHNVANTSDLFIILSTSESYVMTMALLYV